MKAVIKSMEAAMALAILSLVLSLASNKPHLPKPTPECPDCQDARGTLATAKE